ncbi:MAG: aspartate--tRNA(Asn) ligase [Candidatus Lokiarchaeota archaeon]|nr:aspartate--tRNA(Asn) ligase [Candidatus Lokiarchaeota archaeon]
MEKRIYTTDVIKYKNDNLVKLRGWIHSIRELGKISFWQLRDGKGLIQIVIINPKKRSDAEIINSIKNEYVVEVQGIVSHNDKAPNGVEIVLENVKIIKKAVSPLPFSVEEEKTQANFDTRLKYRFLDIRSPKTRAIFSVRAQVIKGARKYFDKNDFTEINTPKIIKVGAEGGTTLFPLYYFGQEVYLAQSPQFYKQMGILGFEKVFEIGPFFRAEKSRTRRHLAESWGIDVEVAFADHKEIMSVQEDLLISIYSHVKDACKNELKLFDVDLIIPKKPFPKISFKEATDIAISEGFEVDLTEDLSAEVEKIIRSRYDSPFFITDFPLTCVAFYYGPHEDNPDISYKLDLLSPGENGLELTSGGPRCTDPEILKSRAQVYGIQPESLGWYLEMFKIGGIPPHAGFGMGIDRLVMVILDLPNVQEAVLCPRTVDILSP